jgi:long-chain acyl-CoA synthetase
MFDVPELFFPEYIRLYARYHPHKLALVVGDETSTWGELEASLCQVANGLQSLGIKPGDRVAVLAENSRSAVYAEFGILKMGAAVVSLSGSVRLEDLAMMLEDAQPKAIFVSHEHTEKINSLRPQLGNLTDERYFALDFNDAGWTNFSEFVSGASIHWQHVPIHGDDTFYITYSSGTTSTPKGIVLSHASRIAYFQTLAIELGFRSDAVVICGTALYSTTTWSLILVGFLCGATVIVLSKFDAEEYCRLADLYCATHTIMVPAQYARILDIVEHDSTKLASMRMIGSTGSKMPLAMKQRLMMRFRGMLHEVYGMTEGMVTALKPSDLPAKINSVGRPMLGNDFRIVDNLDRELPIEETGEIVAFTPSLLREYFRQPEKTREAVWLEPATGRTFLRSGDIGRFDADGYLYLVDRKKDMIVSGGFNIYPADIESILSAHPDVKEACVIGIPHNRWGETPLGLVTLCTSATTSDADQIKIWANEQLGKYQRLFAVEFRSAFPRNPGGKILKRKLREPYWTGKDEYEDAS